MSDNILYLENISELNRMIGVETVHPLISVVDFSMIEASVGEYCITSNFYIILVKDSCYAELKYGRNKYDYQEESMIFCAPRQIIGVENNSNEKGKGFGIFFHADLLKGTSLASSIKGYNFFSYSISEALHLSSEERRSIGELIEKISQEITRPIDKHSRRIIVSSIELLLGYSERYYDRQFVTRETLNHDILTRFEDILESYFDGDMASERGLPTVKYFADSLCLSSNYFSDLIKRETGYSAQEHIQNMIIERAKVKLSTTSHNISDIAYSLGFEYPQYFSRQFKKRVGVTPNEYRAKC